jgi:hypothetical protein
MGTMKQQTAVEWLFQELWETPQDKFRWHTILEQAKEMEKEQIMHAYGQGAADEAGEILDATKDSEEYYNETYGGEK